MDSLDCNDPYPTHPRPVHLPIFFERVLDMVGFKEHNVAAWELDADKLAIVTARDGRSCGQVVNGYSRPQVREAML